MNKYQYWTAAALLLYAVATGRAEARSLSYVCEGKVSTTEGGKTALIIVSAGEQHCSFKIGSPEGKKILQVCAFGTKCSVGFTPTEVGVVPRLREFRTTTTPSFDCARRSNRSQPYELALLLLPDGTGQDS